MSFSLSNTFLGIGIDPAWGGLAVGALLGWVACRLRSPGGGPQITDSHLATETPRIVPSSRPRHEQESMDAGFSASLGTRTVVNRLVLNVGGSEIDLPEKEVEQFREALRSGEKIRAIKILREATGLGLKEAKDVVDALDGVSI